MNPVLFKRVCSMSYSDVPSPTQGERSLGVCLPELVLVSIVFQGSLSFSRLETRLAGS